MINFQRIDKAFSLLEMSIVLIIIGLITASVLVGAEMIKASKINATVQQIQDLNSSLNLFKSKFGAIPGDFSDASNLLDPSATDGDGNQMLWQTDGVPNQLPSRLDDYININEFSGFFHHLTLADMSSQSLDGSKAFFEPGLNVLRLKVNDTSLFAYTDYLNGKLSYYIGASGINITSYILYAFGNNENGLVPLDAKSIDEKLDDGFPDLGIVVATQGVNTTDYLSYKNTVAGECVDTSSQGFTVYGASETRHCHLVIIAQ